jgi:DNA-binding NarL/FixJ family response regulator
MPVVDSNEAAFASPAKRAFVSGDAVSSARISAIIEGAGWLIADGDDAAGVDLAVVVVDAASDSAVEAAANRTSRPEAAATVLVMPAASEISSQLFASGVAGVILSDRLETQLPAALAAIEAGMVVFANAFRAEPSRPSLTVREKQALAMVVLGFSNAEIATKLFVTESTVKSHLSTAFAKLGVRTRSEATALILDPSQGFGAGILAIVGNGNGETIAAPDWEGAA